MDKLQLKVAAAVIRRADTFLLCRRPEGTHLAGHWEFPGGKLEPGETPEQALRRECREELGVELDRVCELWTIRHDYGDREVELYFQSAELAAGSEPRALHAPEIGWYRPAEMPALPILPADLAIVDRLADGTDAPGPAPGGGGSGGSGWGPIPETFSWSASRGSAFRDCPRAYFFHYYLAVGRGEQADPARARLAWRLRHLTSVPLWVGSRVHDTIERLLRSSRSDSSLTVEQAIEDMVARMRREYAQSRRGDQLRTPDPKDAARFHEHEYGVAVPDEVWRQRVEEAREMLRAFARLGYLDVARGLHDGELLGLEGLEQWQFEGVPMWVRIDFAYRDPEGVVHIVDWKTGRYDRGENPLQMMAYASFAARTWGVPLDALDVREVYLRLPEPDRRCRIDAESVAAAEAQMRASIGAMLAPVRDRERNTAREDDFPLAADMRSCRNCFFFKVCPAGAAP
ncbi:MAG: PD-(D/E)XK nuclease family protein [Acidobacteria bacterium]|nr:PD-(D/E)XK nuclease family protein [Acidobacteriota bacterium]